MLVWSSFRNLCIYCFLILFFLFSCIPRQSKENVDISIEVKSTPLKKKTTKVKFSGKSQVLTLASWNIQDLGQSKNTEEIAFMANVLKDFDMVAIQEVVAKHPAGAQKVAELADELNRRGAKWDYRISDPTKSPSVYMSERYAFL